LKVPGKTRKEQAAGNDPLRKGGVMTNPEPGFEIEVASVEEFLKLLKEREEERGEQEGNRVARKAVFVAQMMDRRPSSYGFPLIRRYVVAAFAFGRDRVSYTRTTSNAVELPETYEDMRQEIKRGLEELNLHISLHEGFLRHPADTGRDK
jgi:hypothetical protein